MFDFCQLLLRKRHSLNGPTEDHRRGVVVSQETAVRRHKLKTVVLNRVVDKMTLQNSYTRFFQYHLGY